MVKIISFFIHLLHTIRSFLYKFECFLLRFLPNDPSQNLHLMLIEDSKSMIFLSSIRKISLFPLRKLSVFTRRNINVHLSLHLEKKVRSILLKVLFALIVEQLMNTFLLIMEKNVLKFVVRSVNILFPLKKHILSKSFVNVLIAAIS